MCVQQKRALFVDKSEFRGRTLFRVKRTAIYDQYDTHANTRVPRIGEYREYELAAFPQKAVTMCPK